MYQILGLQQKNLFANISAEEREQEGFVTVVHTFDLLKKMNEVCPHIIAMAGMKVIGYALCMHPKFASEIELLKPMFQEIKIVAPSIHKYIVMGQICIAKDYRNKGIFNKLYITMLQSVHPEFDTIITEVNVNNQRSLNAHYALGFTHLKTHMSKGENWNLIALK